MSPIIKADVVEGGRHMAYRFEIKTTGLSKKTQNMKESKISQRVFLLFQCQMNRLKFSGRNVSVHVFGSRIIIGFYRGW